MLKVLEGSDGVVVAGTDKGKTMVFALLGLAVKLPKLPLVRFVAETFFYLCFQLFFLHLLLEGLTGNLLLGIKIGVDIRRIGENRIE